MLNADMGVQRSMLGNKETPTLAGLCSHHPTQKLPLAFSVFVSCPHVEAIRASFSSLSSASHQGSSKSAPRVTTMAPAGGRCPGPHHLQALAAAGAGSGDPVVADARLLLILHPPLVMLPKFFCAFLYSEGSEWTFRRIYHKSVILSMQSKCGEYKGYFSSDLQVRKTT